jgi:hypothetical protein
MSDDLTLPDFLDRKKNGITHEHVPGLKRADRNGIVWPKKKNWARIERLRREREKREGASLKGCTLVQRKGQ